jgi:hypothetical protein
VHDESARFHDILQRKALLPRWLDGALRAAGVLKDGERCDYPAPSDFK